MHKVVVSSVLGVVFALVAACNPLDTDPKEFGCDKTDKADNPHCTDFVLTGDVDSSKTSCTNGGGKVVDKCAHGLGGCKGVKTTLTDMTTWYFPDATVKTAEDVKANKCGATGQGFVDP